MKILTFVRLPRFIAVALALALSIAMALVFLSAPPPAFGDSSPVDPTNPATPPTVSADALPTVQIDGVAWAQVVVGDTVYVAGKFTTARPAGVAVGGPGTVTRNNLLAYNINTGNLITSFAPSLNAQALGITASPDGSRIYVVGDFTAVDGAGYYRIAAFSTATGQIIPSFRPILESQARTVVATNTTVYMGGTFSTVNGTPRSYIAQVNASDGSLTSWNPGADLTVEALALTPDGSKVIVGGRFSNLGGQPNYGLGAVDTATGLSVPWAANQKVRDGGVKASITSLFATNDRIYGTGYVYGSLSDGNLEGVFSADPDTGNLYWIDDCHGDSYSVYAMGDVVYDAGHPHFCGDIGGFPQTDPWTYHHTIAFSKAATGTVTANPYGGYYNWAGNPSPSLLNWFPQYVTGSFTGQGQAAWSLAGNSQYLVVGGEFPYVNGVAQYGLTRYAVHSIAPNKVGPKISTALVPNAVSYNKGEARVSWTATYDQDNTNLSYKVVRDGDTANPVYQTTQQSTFWQLVPMGFIDKNLTPGSTHSYRVYVTDPDGNSISRLGNTVTIASTDSGGAYSDAVTADAASAYWPLNESSGSDAYDHVGFTDLQLGAGVTRGATGPLSGVPASTFDGASDGVGSTTTSITGPNTFSAEAWVRTTSTRGGKILGFGNATTGASTSYDRHVYMDNAGHIWFGVYPGSAQTVSSAATFNDGLWHHVVASLGSNGMRLYVDGRVVGSRDDVTTGQAYSGYWIVGGDSLNGWPSKPTSNFLNGDIAQVAIYPTVLTKTQVIDHFVAAGGVSPIPPAPADAYGAAVYNNDPLLYWRLNDTTGTAAADSGQQGNPGTFSGGSPTKGVTGAISGTSNAAVNFNSQAIVSSDTKFTNPTTYSLETWFNTTTTTGGKLIGFGDKQTGLSSNYDRHIYMQDDGRLVFGVYTGQTNVITTANPYNDGSWHYVVATQSSDGMKLYVDGALVGTNPQTAAQSYSGYWRIGGDQTWGSTSPYFTGTLDEVAVYNTELTAAQVSDHYAIGTGAVVNQPPTAAFTSTMSNLNASFDASTSSDPDGTVASYAWDFGDGLTGTGATATHSYAAAGNYTVTLTVTDNQGATNTVSHGVVAVAPNVPPTAAFTSTVNNLNASFDASTSSDPDGTVASYAWDFGDGLTGTGATATHSYAAAGNYTVSLVVTDNQGAASTATTHSVTVTAPVNTGTVLAQDSFGRTLASGWGSADVGGAWTITGNSANLSVSGGTGQMNLAAGSTRTARLNSVSSTDVDLSATMSISALPTGKGSYTDFIGRQVGSSQYIAEVWIKPTGAVYVVLEQGSTVLSVVAVPGITYTAGSGLQVRAHVTGTSPTTVQAKVWPTGQAEPSAWTATTTDTTAALQAAGSIGVQGYLSGSATSAVTTSFSNLSATSTIAPPANQPPTAAFTTSTSGLGVTVDGSASTDPDGTVASYAWTFGDGQTGTGATASHSYAAAGTYTVGLTVTDNSGAPSAAVTHQVTVTAPPANVLAQDAFGRTLASGWGSADVGGAWTNAGSASAYSVSSGTGQQLVPGGSTKTSSLSSFSQSATDLLVGFTTDKAPTGGGIYISAIGRDVGTTNYQARVWLQASGLVQLQLLQGGTALQLVNITGVTYTPGTVLQLRLQVFGTSPTTVRARVWASGQTEPSTWQASVTDSTAALQTTGSVGLRSYLSGTATDTPVAVRFSGFLVSPPQ